jgi:CRP/FNR family transcriptional regulator, cyclic AMP receptor protein
MNMAQSDKHADAHSASSHAGLDEHELRALSAHASLQAFGKNAVIINEGDQSESIFVISSGRVRVFLRGEDGKEVTLNVHGPGEYFGEMVLDEGPRSASVIALEPARLFVIAKTEFRNFLAANPDFAMKLINRLMRRVRALTESVGNLALLDVYGRVARLLLEKAQAHDGRLLITEKLTQQDIADRVGASREMISRIFKDLVAGGYISMEGKQITIARDLPRRW